MLPRTVAFLNGLGLGDFTGTEQPERMAWVARVLRNLPDADDDQFPHGKWATIQSIESQVDECAAETAAEIALASVFGATP